MGKSSKSVKSIRLSGKVYLQHYQEDDASIGKPQIGDLYFYIYNEDQYSQVLLNHYQIKGYKGYFKVKIYDGYQWCFLDCSDFFLNKEHHFAKHEIILNIFNLSKEIIEEKIGHLVYRGYREHYSMSREF